jgi:hypothetical protein
VEKKKYAGNPGSIHPVVTDSYILALSHVSEPYIALAARGHKNKFSFTLSSAADKMQTYVQTEAEDVVNKYDVYINLVPGFCLYIVRDA